MLVVCLSFFAAGDLHAQSAVKQTKHQTDRAATNQEAAEAPENKVAKLPYTRAEIAEKKRDSATTPEQRAKYEAILQELKATPKAED